MGPTVALLSFFVVLATGQPAGQKPCCESKEVGGVKYMLTGTMDTKAYGCITNCLYETKAKPDMKFCFAPGDLEVECLDDGSSKPPKGDSTKPPKEENSKPPMDGSSKPPMEGSSKPPMDKTSKPPMEETSKPPMDGSSKSPDDGSTKPSMGSSSEKRGTTAASSSNEAYCTLDSGHTMCKYQGPSGSCAAKTIFRGLSQEGKRLILERHNELRRKVAKGQETGGINPPQPAAANMRKLVWNTELEEIAQRWADQCTFGHDKVRTKLDGTSVGQNAYIGY